MKVFFFSQKYFAVHLAFPADKYSAPLFHSLSDRGEEFNDINRQIRLLCTLGFLSLPLHCLHLIHDQFRPAILVMPRHVPPANDEQALLELSVCVGKSVQFSTELTRKC